METFSEFLCVYPSSWGRALDLSVAHNRFAIVGVCECRAFCHARLKSFQLQDAGFRKFGLPGPQPPSYTHTQKLTLPIPLVPVFFIYFIVRFPLIRPLSLPSPHLKRTEPNSTHSPHPSAFARSFAVAPGSRLQSIVSCLAFLFRATDKLRYKRISKCLK